MFLVEKGTVTVPPQRCTMEPLGGVCLTTSLVTLGLWISQEKRVLLWV